MNISKEIVKGKGKKYCTEEIRRSLRQESCPNAAVPHGSGIQNSEDRGAACLILVPWKLAGAWEPATWRQVQISKEAASANGC